MQTYPIKEFKQCPFCGRIWMSIVSNSDGKYSVRCLCGARGPSEISREKAIRGWNTRDRHLLWNPFRLSIKFPNDSLGVDFKGRLDSIDLATVLQTLASKEKTGILQLTKGHGKSAICLKDGNIIAASDSSGLRLGQLLFNNGLISHEKLREALNISKKTDKLLGEVLLNLRYIDAQTLKEVIQQQVQEAVLELFFWKEGNFEYRDCVIEFDKQGANKLNTMEVIMEAARRLDEWDELKLRVEKAASMQPPEAGPVRIRPPFGKVETAADEPTGETERKEMKKSE